MRVIESGYAINLYCGNKLAISNKEGQQIFQGETQHPDTYNEKKLRAVLKGFIPLYEKGVWDGMMEDL